MVRRSARCRAHSRRAAVHMGRSDGLEVQLEVRSIYEGRSERRAGKGGGDRHGNRHEDRGDRRAAYSNVIDSAAIKDSAWRPVAVSVLVYPAASVTLAGHSEIRAPWGVGCCEAQHSIQSAGQAKQLRRIDVDLVLDKLRKVLQRPMKLFGSVWLATETFIWFGETYTGVAGEVGLKGHSVQVEVYGSIPAAENLRPSPHIPSKVVKPPLERECGRGRDHFIAFGRA